MTDEEQKVCDVCRERLATHHTCFGDTGEMRSLCMICFEESAFPAEMETYRYSMEVVRNGKCRWCGAPAVGGSICSGIERVMAEETDLWCEHCRAEFGSRPENEIPEFPFDDEAAQAQVGQQLADYERRKVEFMNQRLKERSR
jgi:hypothetical protein